jgi:choice-of-anchor B domain-containing protein
MLTRHFIFVLVALFAATITPVSGQNYNFQKRSSLTFPGQELANICGYWQNGREYALVGGSKGLIIVDITNPDQPVQLIQIPGPDNRWKEIKTLGHYCYVTSEGGGGVQIIDLSPLPAITLPVKSYTGDGEIANRLGTIHALHIDTTTAYLYAFGSSLFNGGAVVLDLQDPFNPKYAGKFDALGYIHDGYVDNDTLYAGHIYTGTLSIVDMHDKANPVVLGTTNTPSRFTHNAWITSDRKHILTTDERTPSFVTAYDVSDPTNITELDRIATEDGTTSIGHNTHIINDYAVTSWYSDGVTIVDAHRPQNLVEVGRFDTWQPAVTGSFFVGCWGAFPYFPSGTIVLSNMNPAELIVVTPTYTRACYLEGTVKEAATGNPIAGATVVISANNKSENSRADGTFKTGYYKAGSYTVTVSKLGYISKTINFSLANGQVTPLEVLLDKSASIAITGTVIEDVSGAPIEEARVRIIGTGIDSLVLTNGSGQYSVNFPEGSYSIEAYAWGYRNITATFNSSSTPAVIRLVKDIYYDNFRLDYGWFSFGGASSGFWERGVPKGTTFNGLSINPGTDNPTDEGSFCYVTGNGGGQAGNDDVDNGFVTIVSPLMKLANLENAVLTFDYWFANNGGSGTPNDTFFVKVTNGIEEVTILTHTQPQGQWRQSGDIELRGYIALTDEVQIIFTADDTSPGHLVEAAIDVFKVVPGKQLSVRPDVDATAFLRAFPNPSAQQFVIAYDWQSAGSQPVLEVRNAHGQLVQTQALSDSKGSLSIGENWLSGIYFATLRSKDGRQGTPVKLIKM